MALGFAERIDFFLHLPALIVATMKSMALAPSPSKCWIGLQHFSPVVLARLSWRAFFGFGHFVPLFQRSTPREPFGGRIWER